MNLIADIAPPIEVATPILISWKGNWFNFKLNADISNCVYVSPFGGSINYWKSHFSTDFKNFKKHLKSTSNCSDNFIEHLTYSLIKIELF